MPGQEMVQAGVNRMHTVKRAYERISLQKEIFKASLFNNLAVPFLNIVTDSERMSC